MSRFIVKLFIKNYESTEDPVVRNRYGLLAGFLGILTNALLSGIKIVGGLFFNSISIMADGLNNLADASSSVILLVGIKLSAKPPDEAHPYGHARIEYITGLVISFAIIILGAQLLINSFAKIGSPATVDFSWLAVILLVISISIKIWQAFFYIYIGNSIKSTTIKATFVDSRNDVIATSSVLVGLLIGEFTGYSIDAIMGCAVSLFIIYSGFKLVRETAAPLLGNPPDPDLVKEIKNRIQSYEGVLGIHDLIVHNYGPGRIFATVHVEVDAHGDLIAGHEVVDLIEREVGSALSIELVAHIDPLDTKDPLTLELKGIISEYIDSIPGLSEIHDLRVVAGYRMRKIVFDVVAGPDCTYTNAELQDIINRELQKISDDYSCVITIDRSYT
ncbi:cation diffusion facilitator family transporter [Bacillota bacterium]